MCNIAQNVCVKLKSIFLSAKLRYEIRLWQMDRRLAMLGERMRQLESAIYHIL